jgi:hypothetical protein
MRCVVRVHRRIPGLRLDGLWRGDAGLAAPDGSLDSAWRLVGAGMALQLSLGFLVFMRMAARRGFFRKD